MAFGFVLSRNGAVDFDAMYETFLFRDFHLFGVAIVATALTMAGLWVLRSGDIRVLGDRLIRWSARPVHRGSIFGAISCE